MINKTKTIYPGADGENGLQKPHKTFPEGLEKAVGNIVAGFTKKVRLDSETEIYELLDKEGIIYELLEFIEPIYDKAWKYESLNK